MRTLHLILAIVAFAFMAPVTANAATSVDAKESRELIVKKLMDQKTTAAFDHIGQSKMMKKAIRMAKWFGLGDEKVDFQSEPDKWLWYGVFGWVIGTVLWIFGWFILPFWYLGYLCWTLGTVCFIVWFLKKNGAI